MLCYINVYKTFLFEKLPCNVVFIQDSGTLNVSSLDPVVLCLFGHNLRYCLYGKKHLGFKSFKGLKTTKRENQIWKFFLFLQFG